MLAGVMTMTLAPGCARTKAPAPVTSTAADGGVVASPPARPPRPALPALRAEDAEAAEAAYVYDEKSSTAAKVAGSDARAAGMLVVDLSDAWAPFIFQDGTAAGSDVPKPNGYRNTFIELANDRINADGRKARWGEHNFIEPFGIPPTLSVLRTRVQEDMRPERQACDAQVDVGGLADFTGNVGYLDREHARREHAEALRDATWLDGEFARREAAATTPPATSGGDAGTADAETPPATWKTGDRAGALAVLRDDPNPKLRARLDRTIRGQERVRAVRAVQARLVCEGLLSPRSRYTPGMFDLPTHEALADWERKNDIFGWASISAGGETLAALSRPALELDLDTFRRIVAERVADAAGILEDGSTAKGKHPATYVDRDDDKTGDKTGAGADTGNRRAVPDLIGVHVDTLLDSIHVHTATDLVEFLGQHGPDGLASLKVAFHAPALPPYYGPRMDLSVEIDRGDVWYDFPFDARGRAAQQARDHFPHLTMFVTWRNQKIPLVRWRTTIGSWRSELHANGKVYYKYKNSDVGPRFWRNVVAGPVWIPPDATPAKDLLTRKVLDRDKGPEIVVNTDVMGPGFQSAYGLVMAIHIDRRGFDNQIRTHGSVDYTSIARRFSHGCHRLVNNRAVRLFDFVLRRQSFRRMGSVPLHLKRKLVVDENSYAFELLTRGYYYELAKPIPITIAEGRIMGAVKTPIAAYVRKAGVDYGDVSESTSADAATTVHTTSVTGQIPSVASPSVPSATGDP